jgi:hypothetical protein
LVTDLLDRAVAVEAGRSRGPSVTQDDDLVALALLDVESVAAAESLFADDPIIVGATRAGAPYTAGAVGQWLDDMLFSVSGPRTRKSRNLAADPRCTFAISLPDLDLVLEGIAARVTEASTLARVAKGFTERGWPLEVEDDDVTASFWAPTAPPPPPWHFDAFSHATALGVATAPPGGATCWCFGSSSADVRI